MAQREESKHVNPPEPSRLVPGGRDDEVQMRTLFIPDSVVIAGDHVKSVLIRRKVRIESLSPCAGVLPVCVNAFEFVTKKNSFGDGKAQSRIVELQVPLGCEYQRAVRPAKHLAFGDDVIDEHRWRNSIRRTPELRRIDPRNPFGGRKPKYAGRRLHK
jgi:hypothetical protein